MPGMETGKRKSDLLSESHATCRTRNLAFIHEIQETDE